MRRSDREVTSRAGIAEIIAACDCCRVGFADAGGVYIVPMNFAYVEDPLTNAKNCRTRSGSGRIGNMQIEKDGACHPFKV